ncbi:MAG: SDR family NAD(P)-dependent oxidoreductase [Deltaproteobacteria bacterium]|nr:SDR family NAD(P)-dependent oxidoreductase [Deltaproteobacteria bacterium]
MGRFSGKRVLITGGAGGIGLCTAEIFAREGAELVVADIDAEALKEAERRIRDLGATVHGYQVDVSSREQVEDMARRVLAERGFVDVLINNAGIGHTGELADTSLETWRRLLAVDLWGVLHNVYAFLPSMLERAEGQIVNVSSGQAFFRLPTWGAYAAIKAAVGAFSEILHFELAPRGVSVTTVYPYLVDTGFYRDAQSRSFASRLSIKLMPYYADRPEKVARIIFEAVLRRRPVEMVNVLNDLGYYMHLLRPLASVVSRVSARVLGGR